MATIKSNLKKVLVFFLRYSTHHEPSPSTERIYPHYESVCFSIKIINFNLPIFQSFIISITVLPKAIFLNLSNFFFFFCGHFSLKCQQNHPIYLFKEEANRQEKSTELIFKIFKNRKKKIMKKYFISFILLFFRLQAILAPCQNGKCIKDIKMFSIVCLGGLLFLFLLFQIKYYFNINILSKEA